MRSCMMCGTEKEDVEIVRVAPATWNGFHDFTEVCTECRESRRFRTAAKPKTPKALTPDAATTAHEAGGGSMAGVKISHKRTGALLCVVDGATLTGASLSGAALSGADLQHAAIRGADLHRADLRLADLSGADLRGADLRGADLRGVDLRGADLREARLYRADLRHSLYNTGTHWPSDFDPLASGASKELRRDG